MKALPGLFSKIEERYLPLIDKIEDQNKIQILKFQLYTSFLAMLIMMIRTDKANLKHGRQLKFNLDTEASRELMLRCLKVIDVGLDALPFAPEQKMAVKVNVQETYYHLGRISFEEFHEAMNAIADEDMKQGSGGKGYIFANAVYLQNIPGSPYSIEEDELRARKKINEVMPRILEIKRKSSFSLPMAFWASTPLILNLHRHKHGGRKEIMKRVKLCKPVIRRKML